MSLRRFVYEWAFPFTHWVIGCRVFELEKWLRESQYWPRERLEQFRLERLRRVVRVACEGAPRYRAHFDRHGVSPDDLRCLDNLRKFPLLDKDVLRHRMRSLCTSQARLALLCATSGSTGAPTKYYRDMQQLEVAWAATTRGLEWTGWRFGDPSVRLWHQHIGISWLQALQERMDAFLANRKFVPMHALDPKELDAALAMMQKHKPVLLDGYADALVTVAKHAERRGVELNIPGIVSTAAVLYPKDRALIERWLGGKVFDKYGAREFSGIAWECGAHDGLHVVAEQLIVEILKDDGEPSVPGEEGEVVITDLWNEATPFIRYRVGDFARAWDDSPCACGRTLPKIGPVRGRVQGNIVGANGRVVSAGYWEQFFRDKPVERFRVEQHKKYYIDIFVVIGEGWDITTQSRLERELLAWFGVGTVIRFRVVDEIQRERTGKFVTAISTLEL